MKKTILTLLCSTLVYANCTPEEVQEALSTWRQAIHQDATQKYQTLTRAQSQCPTLEVIEIDKLILEAKQHPTLELLKKVKNLNNNMRVPEEERPHKWNNARQIDQLWLAYYESRSQEKSLSSDEKASLKIKLTHLNNRAFRKYGMKAMTRIGGTYRADLLFDKDKHAIKNQALAKEINDVIVTEIQRNDNALFGLVGGASSGGTTMYNKKLSMQRATALQKVILQAHPGYNKNIKIFGKGESQLVCEGGFLPEKNTQGEYQCITKENKEKSRRVTIRRIR